MRTLGLDGGMGASGDMLLGALLAAGADRSVLEPVEDALGVCYAVSATDRKGIAARSVDVLIDGDGPEEPDHDHHGHDDVAHDHGEQSNPAEGHGPHRHYADVVEIVETLDVDDGPREDALAIFELLGEAEARVHGTDLEETHFHEVGADDAIADVVGVALLLADLDVERVVTTPLSAGGGTVEMSHGTYPVPPPAVVEIAAEAGWKLHGGPVDAELLTPTGAAILAHLAEGIDHLPPMDVEATGYGAGKRSFPTHPNVLRATVGTTEGRLSREAITVLEANLDDTSPEVLGDLQRTLGEVGAHDVSVLPVTMKKSRPGHLVRVVCPPADAARIARRLAEETGTLGVRDHGVVHRWVADRHTETLTIQVDGETFEVAVKVATDGDGTVLDVSAEYEDAARVADESELTTREVMARAEREFRDV
jgi:uncharacterized protein (TIGR00299 family) protein